MNAAGAAHGAGTAASAPTATVATAPTAGTVTAAEPPAAVVPAASESAPSAAAGSAGAAGAVSDSADPSGEAMPVGDLPGWHQVLADDFTEAALDRDVWQTYWGQPGGDPGGWFDPSHVYLSDGMLVISADQDPDDGGRWATGGVSSSPSLIQTYGKYLVRFRMDPGHGIAHAILLWPGDNSWPPEIDFSEDNGTDRQTDDATLHYGPDNTMIGNQLSVDLTQWHTLGVEWTPGRLVYTIDGRAWATVDNANVPDTPMALDIQTQAWACGTSTWEQCPDASTPAHVNLYVDWVAAYAMD